MHRAELRRSRTRCQLGLNSSVWLAGRSRGSLPAPRCRPAGRLQPKGSAAPLRAASRSVSLTSACASPPASSSQLCGTFTSTFSPVGVLAVCASGLTSIDGENGSTPHPFNAGTLAVPSRVPPDHESPSTSPSEDLHTTWAATGAESWRAEQAVHRRRRRVPPCRPRCTPSPRLIVARIARFAPERHLTAQHLRHRGRVADVHLHTVVPARTAPPYRR